MNKTEWKKVKLGDVLVKTETIDPTKKSNEKFIYVDVSSVDNETFKIEYTTELHGKDAPSRARKLIREKDVIFATVRPTLKRIAVVPKHLDEQVCSTGYFVLRGKKSVENKFLFYFLQTEGFIKQMEKLQKGVSYPAVTDSDVKTQLIPLPPLQTQTKIAQTLDTNNKLITLRKKQIEELDTLAEAVFYDMFGDPVKNEKGWEVKLLGQVFDVTSSKRIFENEYVSEGIPFYRTKEVVELSKGNNISTELYISQERYEEIKNRFDIPKKNDLLISAVGTIGEIWIIPEHKEFYFKDGNLLWCKANSSNCSKYIEVFLRKSIKHNTNSLSSGSAYKALTIEKLKKIRVNLPPLALQNHFASIIEKIEQQKTIARQALQESENLFQRLMQDLFQPN